MAKRLTMVALAGLLAGVMAPVPAPAAELPRATLAVLAKLKVPAARLDGLAAELALPAAQMAAARTEGEARILGTWDAGQFRRMTAPFRERWPGVRLNYARAGLRERSLKVLIALKEGRVITDVIVSIGNSSFRFRAAKALADLRGLPGYANLPKGFAAPDGSWVGQKITFRCIAYNTTRVAKADLPATWDGLLANPRWRDGKLGIPNRPNNWVLNLWGEKGEAWATDFINRLFRELKPQLRKEGLNASLGLAVAGEFDAVIPASESRAQQYLDRGAPVGFHCPSPVPMNVSQLAVLRQATHPAAARLFVNWLLSREGQMAQYAETHGVPVHKAMQTREFRPFAEETLGKPVAFRDPELLVGENKKMLAVWNRLWETGLGIAYKTVTAPLLEVLRGGRELRFKVGAGVHKGKVSRRRTKVAIAGKPAGRGDLKPGMSCEIRYTGDGGDVVRVACR